MDEEILEALQKQIEAKYLEISELKRQNDLNEASLKEVQLLRDAENRRVNAEKQRVKIAFDTNDKVSGLLVGWSELIEKVQTIERQNRELKSEFRILHQWLERTDDILLLLLTEKSPQKVDEALDDLQEIINDRKTSQKKIIRKRVNNLNRLKEQAAEYGSTEVPISLLNKIESEEEELAQLLE